MHCQHVMFNRAGKDARCLAKWGALSSEDSSHGSENALKVVDVLTGPRRYCPLVFMQKVYLAGWRAEQHHARYAAAACGLSQHSCWIQAPMQAQTCIDQGSAEGACLGEVSRHLQHVVSAVSRQAAELCQDMACNSPSHSLVSNRSRFQCGVF